MVLSDWPSVWGWNVVLNFNLLPKLLWRLSQNATQSSISIWCNTSRYSIQSDYFLHVLFCQCLCGLSDSERYKWALLVSRSTITHIALFPLGLLDRPTTKSMVIFSHFHFGIGSGCSNPAVLCNSTLTCWHTRQRLRIELSLFIPCHQKCCLRSLYILVPPGSTE